MADEAITTLTSAQFRHEDRLQKALHQDPFHVQRGDRGTFVQQIQDALALLEVVPADFIPAAESGPGFYGDKTAEAVLKFKGPPRNILGPGQVRPDAIVGKKTMAQLEREMRKFEAAHPRPGPVPTGDPVFQDFVIRILGFDPRDAKAGQESTDGAPAINVPDVAALRKMIDTPAYLKGHKPVVILNFNGGGGRANSGSDPTTKVTDKLVGEVEAALKAGADMGIIVVYGYSIGGRNALTVSRAIAGRKLADGTALKAGYVGLIDAAFDSPSDPELRGSAGATGGDSIYQSATNKLRDDPDFAGLEHHAWIQGTTDTDLAKSGSYERQLFDFLRSGRSVKALKMRAGIALFDTLHAAAVRDGHGRVQQKIVKMLTE